VRNLNYGSDEATAVLEQLVPRITYKHWRFELAEVTRGQGCGGLTLKIMAEVPCSVSGETIEFLHLMPVLPANYDEENWTGWIFEQIRMVELHESMELFKVDGEAPYFSEHAPRRNPYAMRLIKTPEQRDALAVPYHGGEPDYG
jgi:hypothetical protein